MTAVAPATEMNEAIRLRDRLEELDREYRNGIPRVTDRTYDQLLRRLQELEARHPEIQSPNSPTSRVGGEPMAGFVTVPHATPMLSLQNVYSEKELKDWIDGVLEDLGRGAVVQFVVEPKIDGVALSLVYELGELTCAVTRGDGKQGDDVTRNARTIFGIPLRIREAISVPRFEVRGEVYMTRTGLISLNKERVRSGEPPLANTRNAAAGAIRLLDSKECVKRRLFFVAHGFGDTAGFSKTPLNDFSQSYHAARWRLHDLGFQVAGLEDDLPKVWPWESLDGLATTPTQVMTYVKQFATGRKISGPYDTDGIVIKVEAMEQRRILGNRSKSPRWAVAYKYEAETARTRVQEIVVQVGKTGKLTPVANLEPVSLCGTVVARASLFNFDEVKRLDIRVGDLVVVKKAAEVIPQVVEALPDGRLVGQDYPVFEPPTCCPSCGSPLRQEPGVVDVFCTAHPASECASQLKSLIRHFCGRAAMDIDGVGEVLIEQLVDRQIVRQLSDLYALTTDDLLRCSRVGQRTAENLVAAIDVARGRKLEAVLVALPIPMVGEGGARRLAEHFKTFEAIRHASVAELAGVRDIGQETAESIRRYFDDEAEAQQLDSLLAQIRIQPHKDAQLSTALAGKTLVVTGTLPKRGRDEIEALIRAHGGRVSGSVSSKTDYLVAGKDAGSKLGKARTCGVTVLTEAEFEELLPAPG